MGVGIPPRIGSCVIGYSSDSLSGESFDVKDAALRLRVVLDKLVPSVEHVDICIDIKRLDCQSVEIGVQALGATLRQRTPERSVDELIVGNLRNIVS